VQETLPSAALLAYDPDAQVTEHEAPEVEEDVCVLDPVRGHDVNIWGELRVPTTPT
jgi:hypothetical protein